MENALLKGIKVLDFTVAGFGPYATRILSDLGADVLHMEPIEGDFTRITGTRTGDSMLFMTSNRNKRSLAVNLRDSRGLEIALKLARQADVIASNFRPGVMKKLGLDYETVSRINPGVICGSFYMYGETGPLAHRRGADIWAQAYTGFVAVQGSPKGPPYLCSVPVIDHAGAIMCALAMVSALFMRERTGVGQEVTTSLLNTGVFLQEMAICQYIIDGILFQKTGRGYYVGLFPYGAYPAKDGDVVTIFGQDDDEWKIFCRILGIEHLLSDPRYDTHIKRTERKEELYPILDKAFRKKTRKEWQQIFREQGMRCDPCLDYAELVAEPQFQANDLLIDVEHRVEGKLKMLETPIKFKAVERMKSKPPPVLGEHTEEILSDELGYDKKEIKRLVEEGVIGIPTEDMLKPKATQYTAGVVPLGKGRPRLRRQKDKREDCK